MSQSPVSPSGKRLRTMADGHESSSDRGQDSSTLMSRCRPWQHKGDDHNANKDCGGDTHCIEDSTNNINIVDVQGTSKQDSQAKNSDISNSKSKVRPGSSKQQAQVVSPNSASPDSRSGIKDMLDEVGRDIINPDDFRGAHGSGDDDEDDDVDDYDDDDDDDNDDDDDDEFMAYNYTDSTDSSFDNEDWMDIHDGYNSQEDMFAVDINDLGSDDSSSGYEDAWEIRDSEDSEDDNEDDEAIYQYLPEEYLTHDPTPDTPYPRPDWITIKELRARQCGFASARRFPRRQNMSWFQRYASSSLWMIQRLQRSKQLESHTGCVNCLDFNSSANLICSGSDDLTVCIWDWRLKTNNLKSKIPTGHAANVFQSQFCNQDSNIVTSSRDGTVRLIDIETSQSELLVSSSGEIGKLTFINPNTFLTCGTNANVNLIDLRTRKSKKLFTVTSPKTNRKCPLHTISSHPLDKHVIAVAGSSPYVFLYDLRRLPREHNDAEIKPTYCLGNLKNTNHIVTSTAFNSTGDKLLISYNDDDLYVCRTDTCEIIHKYKGHRNKKTIKGCAWFGDNYVLSGSDDGHIYGWDLESEHIVCFLKGDEGVVNCLNVHPNLPILVTSGLEHDIKIWEPHANTWPQTMKGIKPQICKNTLRRKRANELSPVPMTPSWSEFDGDETDHNEVVLGNGVNNEDSEDNSVPANDL